MNKGEVPLRVKYAHLQLLRWIMLSENEETSNKVQKIEFLEFLYSKHLKLTVSILAKDDILDVSDFSPNFNEMVSHFRGSVGFFYFLENCQSNFMKQSGKFSFFA